jgi:excisionase family DNA binding protein
METEGFVTIQEAAEILGVAYGTVYSAVQEERLPHTRLLGRVLIARTELERYRERAPEPKRGRPPGSKDRTRRTRQTKEKSLEAE